MIPRANCPATQADRAGDVRSTNRHNIYIYTYIYRHLKYGDTDILQCFGMLSEIVFSESQGRIINCSLPFTH